MSSRKKKAKKLRKIPPKSKLHRIRGLKYLQHRLAKLMKTYATATTDLLQKEVISALVGSTTNRVAVIDDKLTAIEEYILKTITGEAVGVLNDVLKRVQSKVDSSYSIAYNFSIAHSSQDTRSVVDALLMENLELIKSIPQDIIQKSRITLLNSVGAFDQQSVVSAIKEFGVVGKKRAAFIARDQVAKATEYYSQAHAVDLGYDYYIWMTSNDSRVSTGEGGHKILDERIYSYREPTAVIDKNGTLGVPAQRPNCRCTSAPLLLDDNEKLVKVKDPKHGDYYVITRA